MRILFCCHGGGAGHATRSLAVAKEIKKMEPSAWILFICSGAGADFVEINRFQCLRIGQPIPRFFDSLYWKNGYGYSNLIKDFPDYFFDERSIMDKFQPDVVVSDMDFAGVLAARAKKIKTVLISHMVEHLDYPEIGRVNNFLKNVGIKVLYKLPNLIIAPDIIDASIPVGIRRKTRRVGFLMSERDHNARDAVDRMGNRILFVPSALSTTFAIQILRSISRLNGVKVSARIRPIEGLGNVEYVKPVSCLTELIAKSDLVVCSGYSTIMEAVGMRTPCVVIPTNSEQAIVARKGQEKGIIEIADQSSIEEKVRSILENDGKSLSMLKNQAKTPNGTRNAAEIILGCAR